MKYGANMAAHMCKGKGTSLRTPTVIYIHTSGSEHRQPKTCSFQSHSPY